MKSVKEIQALEEGNRIHQIKYLALNIKFSINFPKIRVAPFRIRATFNYEIGGWCNGSTTDSGSVSKGSNPFSPANSNKIYGEVAEWLNAAAC